MSQNFGRRSLNTGRVNTVENYGEPNQLFLRSADINYQQFDLEATFFALENAVAQNPYSADALLRRATFKQRIGMTTEAAEDFTLAYRLNPYAADLYSYNGTYSLLNVLAYEPEEALMELSWTNKLKEYHNWFLQHLIPEKTDYNELVLIESVLFEAEEENFDLASVLLDSLLSNYSNSAVAHDLKGLFLNNEGKYAPATKSFAKAVVLDPTYSIAWYNFGQVERINGNFRKAKEYLDRAVALQPDLLKGYFDRALVLKALGQREEALKDYNRIIQTKSEPIPEVFLNRGLTKKMIGDFGGALADLNTALENDPKNPILHKNHGNLFLLLKYNERAAEIRQYFCVD